MVDRSNSYTLLTKPGYGAAMSDHLSAIVRRDGQRGAPGEPVQKATAMYEGRPLANAEEDIFDQGLTFDLETMLDRRKLLKLVAYSGLSAGLLALVGCGGSSGDDASGGSAPEIGSATTGGSTTGDCSDIPEETAGPYPGDGSNGPDVLSQSGVVRRDITSSFG
jgi:hypothetical protein